MKIQEKLQLVLKFSGLTQQELAGRLGVTFVALNRWINDRAVPRPKAQEKIDELYKEFSGEKQIPETVIEAKKGIVLKKRKDHANVIKEILDNPDIRDQFYLSLTYNSNRIEGSTLSENETAAIMYLFQYLAEDKLLGGELILKLHGILMNTINPDAGNYRYHGVRIMGTD